MRESKAETATAYFAQSARMLSEIAAILGKADDAEKYGKLADSVKHAWFRRFTDNGIIHGGNRQCLYVRPLALRLLPTEAEQQVADQLNSIMEANRYRIGTGFLSTPFLCEVLTRGGHSETAYRTLLNREIPGWLYPVTKGATTVWETWEGYDPDGEPFASHNHYAFGAVMEWIYRYMVGIDTVRDAPGYRRFIIRPVPGGGLRYAGASLETVRGKIACRWEVSREQFILDISVPSNTSAEIRLPAFIREIPDSCGLEFSMSDGFLRAVACAGSYRVVCDFHDAHAAQD